MVSAGTAAGKRGAEPTPRFELGTDGLRNHCSTTELRRLGVPSARACSRERPTTPTIREADTSAREDRLYLSRGFDPHPRAQIREDALRAERPPSDADLTAVADQPHVERIDEVGRDLRLQRGLGRRGGRSFADEPEADRDAVDVRIDGEMRPVEGEQKDARGGLRADARQTEQQLPELGVLELSQRARLVQRDPAAGERAEGRLDPRRL